MIKQGIRFAMAAWLHKQQVRRMARQEEQTPSGDEEMEKGVPVEVDQISSMCATSPIVEDDNSDSGGGVDVQQDGAGEAVEEWTIWANVDSDEEDDDEATADSGTGANEEYSTTPGIRQAAIPITEWKAAEMSHILMRQPAYNTAMWSYPPRQKVQRRARQGGTRWSRRYRQCSR